MAEGRDARQVRFDHPGPWIVWLITEHRFGITSSRKVAAGKTGIEQERQASKETLKKWLRDLPGALALHLFHSSQEV